MHYYNEIDQTAVAWLRNLIAAGLLPQGDVDDRDIRDVQPADLTSYTGCHFFAGIGGWPLALQLAGWPTTEPVWTGSCPCQPFSKAGKGGGIDDPRHLWPQFQRLIQECRPPTVFGEQVAGRAGRAWLSGVRTDLEAIGYGVGAVDIGAAGVGAPHIRQRLWWVADTIGVDNATGDGAGRQLSTITSGHRENDRLPGEAGASNPCGMDDANEGRCGGSEQAIRSGWVSTQLSSAGRRFWDNAESLPCLDGKARRVEPGVAPLVDGFPGRVGQLRAYGNAIVPQVAAEFIKAYMEGVTA